MLSARGGRQVVKMWRQMFLSLSRDDSHQIYLQSCIASCESEPGSFGQQKMLFFMATFPISCLPAAVSSCIRQAMLSVLEECFVMLCIIAGFTAKWPHFNRRETQPCRVEVLGWVSRESWGPLGRETPWNYKIIILVTIKHTKQEN